MSATTKTWVNNSAPSCEDDDLNGFKEENNNLIEGSGQTLNTGDRQQTHKAVSHYAAAGTYYTDSGAADAYVLGVTGSQVAPPACVAGMRVRFTPGNTNTGAAVTVNVAALGVKTVQFFGEIPAPGQLVAGSLHELEYDGTNFQIVPFVGQTDYIDTKSSRENAVINGGCQVAQTPSVSLTGSRQYGEVDMFLASSSIVPSAGSILRGTTTFIGTEGYSLHLSGVSIASASQVTKYHYIESKNSRRFINKPAVVRWFFL